LGAPPPPPGGATRQGGKEVLLHSLALAKFFLVVSDNPLEQSLDRLPVPGNSASVWSRLESTRRILFEVHCRNRLRCPEQNNFRSLPSSRRNLDSPFRRASQPMFCNPAVSEFPTTCYVRHAFSPVATPFRRHKPCMLRKHRYVNQLIGTSMNLGRLDACSRTPANLTNRMSDKFPVGGSEMPPHFACSGVRPPHSFWREIRRKLNANDKNPQQIEVAVFMHAWFQSWIPNDRSLPSTVGWTNLAA